MAVTGEPTERIIAIGDIHGFLTPLQLLIAQIAPSARDRLVTLGDYIDRGPDSRGVIEFLMELADTTRLVPLLGNHDEILLRIRDGEHELFDDWLQYGGTTTLASYHCALVEKVPQEHINFLRCCQNYFEDEHYFFVHANYHEDRALPFQDTFTLRWESLRRRTPGRHLSGKTAIVGHTAQRDFQVFNLGHLVCIDTCCYGGGWLTALDVKTGQLWQANAEGELRQGYLENWGDSRLDGQFTPAS